jgi:hypothetical protein
MLRSLFCRPGLVRGFGLVTRHLPRGEVVLAAAHARGDWKQTGGAGVLWAAPLPIAVAAAGMEEEEGQWKTLPEGYNWENSVTAKGGVRWFVRPSLEKATDSKKKPIQIRSTSQLLLLHKENCFTDLKPEHLSRSKNRINEQQQEQVEQVEVQQVEVQQVEGKGGDTANKLFTETDLEEIHFQFVSKKPYDKDLSKGSFKQEMMSVYGGDAIKNIDNLEEYFDQQQYHYKLDHQFTMF